MRVRLLAFLHVQQLRNSDNKSESATKHYSILFFPSSAFVYLAALSPRSCLATNEPMTLSFRTLLIASLYPSVAQGLGLSFGQLTCHD